MAIFKVEDTREINSNGQTVGEEIDTPACAVLIREDASSMDTKKMETYGSAVLFGHKRIAVTSYHVKHSINFEGSGLVYSKKGGLAVIQDAEDNLELGLKVLILASDINLPVCTSEDLENPIEDSPVPVLIQGYGGDGVNEIEKPPLLRQLKGDATHPKEGDSDEETDSFEYDPQREFVAEDLKTKLCEGGKPVPPILDEADSGSAALRDPAPIDPWKTPPVCYGLLDRTKEFGTIKTAIFVRFDKKAVDWIRKIAKSYGYPLPEDW